MTRLPPSILVLISAPTLAKPVSKKLSVQYRLRHFCPSQARGWIHTGSDRGCQMVHSKFQAPLRPCLSPPFCDEHRPHTASKLRTARILQLSVFYLHLP
ncbi:hypothetical protein E2C01_037984 [Portunus trituberculatus]|uniref:Uncharacterized protein n=1 Tax=Portunus trituberculatus TaxID=210409 RepID=A0A5B7FCY6_PORTR|nr:hypothetical protein [Portunus trituberculatus]